MARIYEPWDNERLDMLLQKKGNIIARIGNVDRYRDKLLVKCKVCLYEWMATPQTLERSGCPKCYITKKTGARKKPKYRLKEVKHIMEANGYTLLNDVYLNNKEPLQIVKNDTGDIEDVTLRSFLARNGYINPYSQ